MSSARSRLYSVEDPYPNGFIENWIGFKFSSGTAVGPDYVVFQRRARASLKRMVEEAGFTIHTFIKSHFQFSAVLQHKETGAFVYLSISDVRFFQDQWYNNILYRTMAHERDWTGGQNHFTDWPGIPRAITALVAS